ncbi:primary-amine oxidase [Wickerhamomyces ciferrii]|uniref:Amine oxidase n=1 Tax=Wickerhamomyces ciferrii (strain ATCC 14091 / BCRC 22168 / CBS 111 / JCM 3599 / NBRC 0793 / NRRL Y-1031 F-60-10) TaxID=1206466 RepID=K0KLJ0_WICCF|nr:primary-amine oxidase [Wickerhamomyces ciferrii]CCH43082.1 primary-amine oxidase [Wickerhamomyces ciferrii]
MSLHPFDSITDAEIRLTTKLVKDLNKNAKIHFTQLDRLEPPKKDALKYLDAEKNGRPLPQIPRKTFVYYYLNSQMPLYKALVNVTYGHIIANEPILKKGVIGPLLPEDLLDTEIAVLENPATKAEIAKLNLPDNIKVCCDTWMYGTDSDDIDRPLVQGYVYLKLDHPDANHYSLPVKFSPVIELLTGKFVRMDYLPAGVDEKTVATQPWKQVEPVEYHPSLSGEVERPLKPLIVQQPEGASFTVEGSKIKWQGWEFRVSTNVREGFAIYDVYFKGRSLFYRMSLNEMTVPYGDPRAPYHRKQAFDLGDIGFGVNANQLNLGCDCLGVIKYLDTLGINREGEPWLLTNTVCMHEQDYGILYKHLNYRNSHAVVTRRREFVVQTIATVGNYEYIVNFVFDQAGAITVQVRATGILSTMPIDDGVDVPWGTKVGPGVMAAYHQHLLSFRFDCRLDGDENTAVYDDYVPMELDDKLNKYGVGYVQKRTILEKSGYIEQSPFTNRAYKVINENSINKITGKPVGYKFEMPAKQMLIARPESYNYKRATYSTQQFWVTKHEDDRNYAAGDLTNQSTEDTGLYKWANGEEDIRNKNLIVWPTLALTHPPVTEQFPVMPSDFMQFLVTPSSFFEKNPALDVPLATNSFNKSKYFEEKSSGDKSCCKTTL